MAKESDADQVANSRTSMLGVRVRDSLIRDFVQQFKDCSIGVTNCTSVEESERSIRSMGAVLETLQQA